MLRKTELFLVFIWEGLIFCILRLLFVNCEISDVKKQKYVRIFTEPDGFTNEEKKLIQNEVVESAIDQYNEINDKSEKIDDKVKFLFGINTFFVIVLLGTKQFFSFNDVGEFFICIIFAFSIFNFILVLQIFTIKTYMKPKIDFNRNDVASDYRNYYLLRDYLKSASHNGGVIDFKVDLSRGTYRAIKTIIFSVVLLAIFGTKEKIDSPKKSDILELKIDVLKSAEVTNKTISNVNEKITLEISGVKANIKQIINRMDNFDAKIIDLENKTNKAPKKSMQK